MRGSIMYKLRQFSKKIFTSVTIMFIPHNSRDTLRFRLPAIALIIAGVFSIIGATYVSKLAYDAFRYKPTKEKLDYYMGRFTELESTINSLKLAETQFRGLFQLQSKKDVLTSMNTSDTGELDMGILRQEIDKTIESVSEIRDYLSEQRDRFLSTPMGLPVKSVEISSDFGYRVHPITGERNFHSGLDMPAPPGTPVYATADGIVSFSGRSGGNGNLVAIEHGSGFSTYYAHNKKLQVSVGQLVKRGDIIALVGSTGSSTGPHCHYEIWKNGRSVDPSEYLQEGRF